MTSTVVIPLTGQLSCARQSSSISALKRGRAVFPEVDSSYESAAMTITISSSISFGWTAEPCSLSHKLKNSTLSCRLDAGYTSLAVWGSWDSRGILRNTKALAVTGGVLNTSLDSSPTELNRFRTSEVAQKSSEGEEVTLNWRQPINEAEEAKAVLSQFLKARGMNSNFADFTARNASVFTAHLLSVLHSEHRGKYLSGDELSSDQIRSTVWLHLRILSAKYGKGFADVITNFPQVSPLCTQEGEGSLLYNVTNYEMGNKKFNLAEYPTLLGLGVDGQLPYAVSYLFSIGLSPDQVEEVLLRAPFVAGYDVKPTIMQVVDYIVFEMGVPTDYIPRIVKKRPQLFGCSVDEKLRPNVTFIESLGVGKDKWPKILVAFPHILTYSLTKLKYTVDFLVEIGFSQSEIGKVVSRFPHIVGYSLEAKLRPTCVYFESIGIADVSHLVMRSPQTFGLSLEGNIKITINFLVGLGYTIDEVALMVYRFPQVLGLNVDKNLQPKWAFFGLMDRNKSELVEFPQYFGYSLRKRIEPRYKSILENGISTTLNHMLSVTDASFQSYVRRGGPNADVEAVAKVEAR